MLGLTALLHVLQKLLVIAGSRFNTLLAFQAEPLVKHNVWIAGKFFLVSIEIPVSGFIPLQVKTGKPTEIISPGFLGVGFFCQLDVSIRILIFFLCQLALGDFYQPGIIVFRYFQGLRILRFRLASFAENLRGVPVAAPQAVDFPLPGSYILKPYE